MRRCVGVMEKADEQNYAVSQHSNEQFHTFNESDLP